MFDMVVVLREWWWVLWFGGEVVFSVFGCGLFGLLLGLWCEWFVGEGVKFGVLLLGCIGMVEVVKDLFI